MSFTSDVIQQLSYATPLAAGITLTTEKVIAGQYSSMAISVATDQDVTLLAQFSNDGANWDISITKNIVGLSNSYENIVILGKWIRLAITNNSIIDQSYLRMYTYGAVLNTSLSATISKIGNLNPEIDVSNLPLDSYGSLSTSEFTPTRQYIFNAGTGGRMDTQAWTMPYRDIHSYANNTSTYLSFAGGVIKIALVLIGEKALLLGAPFTYHPGQGLIARFSGIFLQGAKNVSGPGAMTQYVGIGNGIISSGTVENCYAFGYGDPSLPADTQDSFGIIHCSNGSRVFYPRTIWNLDKANGTNVLPMIDFTLLNVFQIRMQYLGAGNCTFYIENPDNGLFVAVHQIRFANSRTTSNIGSPSMGLLVFGENEAGVLPITTSDYLGISSFAAGVEGKMVIPYDIYSLTNYKSVGAEISIISFRNNSTFYSTTNYRDLVFAHITAAAEGTNTVLVKIYRNAVITAPTWSSPISSIHIEKDTVGTFGGGGDLLFTFPIGQKSDLKMNLTKFNLSLPPGETLTITGFCASTSVLDVALTFHSG